MTYIIDGIVVLVIAICAIIGFKKGFLKHIVLLLVTVLSAGGAMLCMNNFTDTVFDKFVSGELSKASEGFVQSVNITDCVKQCINGAGLGDVAKNINDGEIQHLFGEGELSDNFEQICLQKGITPENAAKAKEKFSEKMNEKISELFGKQTGNKVYDFISGKVNITNGQISKAANLMAGTDKKAAAEYINTNIFSPVVKSVLKVLVFIVSFILIYLVIRLILRIFGVMSRFSSYSFLNRFGGLLLGIVKGGIYILIAAFLLCLLVNSTNDGITGLDVKTFEGTRIFRYFFDIFYS